MPHTVALTGANFKDIVDDNELVIVDFWAEWCGPCKSFAPVFSAAAENNQDIVFGKVDTEQAQDLANVFQIRSIPTLMVFKEQIVVFSKAGAMPAGNFEELIKQAKLLDMDEVRAEIDKQASESDESQTTT
ncbi:MAG: thioredoxin [Gammaproteobacteria bacterium]